MEKIPRHVAGVLFVYSNIDKIITTIWLQFIVIYLLFLLSVAYFVISVAGVQMLNSEAGFNCVVYRIYVDNGFLSFLLLFTYYHAQYGDLRHILRGGSTLCRLDFVGRGQM